MWALLPLKNFDDAKQRLSAALTRLERRGLFQAMVQDVLGTLSGHANIEGILLISEDPSAQLLADLYEIEFLSESSLGVRGLNGAVAAGVEHLSERGIEHVMVIHGDLPLISATDISSLIKSHMQIADNTLTLVPDAQNQGTNCLICRPGCGISFCYGEHSLARHYLQAEKHELTVNIKRLWGVSWDMDTLFDLNYLLDCGVVNRGCLTREFLNQTGIENRIRAHAVDDWQTAIEPTGPQQMALSLGTSNGLRVSENQGEGN